MTPAEPLLNHRQRKFALRALKLPSTNPANQLLPSTLKYGDGNAQPEQYSDGNLQWINQSIKPADLAQRLAKKLTNGLNLDPSEGFEEAYIVKKLVFPGDIIISSKESAELEAKIAYTGLTIWSDGSKLDSEATGAGIAWKTFKWNRKCLALGRSKEIFDAELFGLLEAFKIAIKEKRKKDFKSLTIFSDSQTAILRILNDELGPGQALAKEIIRTAEKLSSKGVQIFIRWVPSHINIQGNEEADSLAKKAANQPKNILIDGYSSFSYINRLVQKEKLKETRNWLLEKQEKRQKQLNQRFTLENDASLRVNKEIFATRKQLSNRFFQIKIGHAITASYLKRIKKSESSNCWWCNNRHQTIEHLLLECQHWRKQRRKFYSDLENSNIIRPRKEDTKAKFKLFKNSKVFKAILAFLNAIDIGRKLD